MTETTKTTTTRKPRTATKAKVEVEQVETVQEVVEEVKKPVTRQVAKTTLDESDLVTVMNNTTGRYMYKSRDNRTTIELEEYGDTASITFGELKLMFSGQKKHITEAFIIILDEDAVEGINYTKQYQNILDPEQVEELLTKPEVIKEVLPKMPKTMQEVVIYTAKRKFKNDELSDIRIVNAIRDASKINILE